MPFTLTDLPYEPGALEPYISRETLAIHHGTHHRNYVTTLNTLIRGTMWENRTLVDIVREAKHTALHNNAAQAWNHEFYWNCMTPQASDTPPKDVGEALSAAFGSWPALKKAFTEAALGHFGSGWAWLVARTDGLVVETTHDAVCPLETGATPMLACDLWEHAYYIDYRNRRADYVAAWWRIVDWAALRRRLQERGMLMAGQ